MKIEIGKDVPKNFESLYSEEFELFSHFEVTAGGTYSFICNYNLERK